MFARHTSLLVLLLLSVCGCRSDTDTVTVFSALDSEFSEPLLDDFEQQTGIVVRKKFDVESTKTVGLVTRIIREEKRPSCDVFWNNEILHTLRLQKKGLLEAYISPSADGLPSNYRSADDLWYGLAARARVLIVNTDLVAPELRPDSILDLEDPRWRGRTGVFPPG